MTRPEFPYDDKLNELRKTTEDGVSAALLNCSGRCLDDVRDRHVVLAEVMAKLEPLLVTVAGIHHLCVLLADDQHLAQDVIEDGHMLPDSELELRRYRLESRTPRGK